jgi:hypothetical protein
MVIKSSDYYKEKLDSYNSQFTSALDDFKKYYVFFNANPELDEYKNMYDNIVKQLQTIIKGVNNTTDEIQNDVQIVDDTITMYNTKMDNQRKLNKEFTNINSSITDGENGSEIRKQDFVSLYNSQYKINWFVFIGIILAILILLKVFKGQKSQDYNPVIWIILLLLIVLVYWVLLKLTTYFFSFKPLKL